MSNKKRSDLNNLNQTYLNRENKRKRLYFQKQTNSLDKNILRIWLTTQHAKEDLKRWKVTARTVKAIYKNLCAIITPKSNIISNKSLDFLSYQAKKSKKAVMRAVKLLNETKLLNVVLPGRGRTANVYKITPKETGVLTTKNGNTLPFLKFKDLELLRSLSLNKLFRSSDLHILTYILIFAGNEKGVFMASKETMLNYSGVNKKTLDKVYKKLEILGIMVRKDFPNANGRRSPYNRGNQSYFIDRKKLSEYSAEKPVWKKPAPKTEKKPAEETGPNGFDVYEEFKRLKKTS